MSKTDLLAPSALAVTDFRRRAAGGLHPGPSADTFDPETGTSRGPSDFELNPDMLPEAERRLPARPAAVLVGVVMRDALTVLLTERAADLAIHPGQVAFPGGRVDPTDASPVAAALREAEEEIGLAAESVEPLGFLDTYRTGTNFAIVPLVGLVHPDFVARPNPSEVADVFEVPLAFLMNPARHERHSREWRGKLRSYYAMPYGDRYIWGATAGILKNMHARLFGR